MGHGKEGRLWVAYGGWGKHLGRPLKPGTKGRGHLGLLGLLLGSAQKKMGQKHKLVLSELDRP